MPDDAIANTLQAKRRDPGTPKIASTTYSRLSAGPQPSLPEAICCALREAIVSGRLVPGQLLRQEELAGQFNASRVPLREALQQLQAEGLVVLRPRRGYAVATLDGRQLFEILQLRILVEGHRWLRRDAEPHHGPRKDVADLPLGDGPAAADRPHPGADRPLVALQPALPTTSWSPRRIART